VKQSNAILSIITINYNDCLGLKKTAASVASQSNQNFEYIIIDGGSNDGSAEYLKENENSFGYACSEKDKGIYDAQNKGIAKSTGKYLLFLNAGDTFHSDQVVEQFLKQTANSDKGIIYGNSLIISPSGAEKLLTPPANLNLNFWYRNTLNHQAVFIQKTLFDKYALYDLNFRICADFDFFLKVFVKENAAFEYLPLTVCNYFEGGFSANPANYDKMLAEKETVLKKHLSKKEYAQIRRAYVRSLPFRKQVLAGIYQTPVLDKIFKKIYPLISPSSKK
jgi:glycosyltransferase involved in cell wall biosynthesis